MTFQSEYRGSTTGYGFGSFRQKAANGAKAAKQRTEQMVRDAKTKTESDNLSFQSMQAGLRAQQAKANAGFAAVKGLASIMGQTASGINELHNIQKRAADEAERERMKAEQEAWDNQWIDFVSSPPGTEMPANLMGDDEELANQELQVNSEARGIATVSTDVLRNDPTLEGSITAAELNNSSVYSQTAERRMNAVELAVMAPQMIAEAFDQIDVANIPSDPRQRLALIKGILQQHFGGASQYSRYEKAKLTEVIKGAVHNASTSLARRRSEFLLKEGAARTEMELNGLASASGALSGQALWDQARDSVAFSTGNKNRGYNSLNTQKAWTSLRQRLVKNGDAEGLRKLRGAVINPATGKTIGQTFPGDLQNAILEAEKNRMAQTDAVIAARKHELTTITNQYLHGEMTREQAIESLQGIGTEAARREIETLTRGQGIAHRPELEMEIESRAYGDNPVPPEVIAEWRSNGWISDKAAKQFGPSGQASVNNAAISGIVGSEFKADLRNNLQANTTSGKIAGDQWLSNRGLDGELKRRAGVMTDLIKRDLRQALGSGRLNENDRDGLHQFAEDRIQHYLKQDRFKLDDGDDPGYAAPIQAKPDLNNPDLANAVRGGDGTWSMTRVGNGQLSSAAPSQLNPARNLLFRTPDLKEEIKNLVAGKPVSERVTVIARKLGISEYQVLNSQAKKYGLPSIASMMAVSAKPELSGGSPGAVTGPITDMKQGYSMLRGMGIPHIGAAYLSGNIMQESSWQGQRSWGEVMGDGSDRNGGIVSWMDDAAKGHFRLRNIERKLGKPINQATTQEQARAMLDEMKGSYPDAYRVFMNPNSSHADLKWASRRYWGYGHEGKRFQYAQQLAGNPPRVQRTSNSGRWSDPIYRIGSRGYGSTGPHLDVKPVKSGGVYGNRAARMQATDLDDFVGVQTASGVKPLSQGTVVTADDQAHRNRGSFGVDYATPDGTSGMPVVLRNGARVIENWVDPAPTAQGSHRTVIELPDGRRYAFVHGTAPNS